MTRLVASILVESVSELPAQTAAAWSAGADAVELRIDAFDGDPGDIAAFVGGHKDRTWVVTCRSAAEGGGFSGATSDRVAKLIAATRDTGAFVDFELADFLRSENIRQKILLAATTAGPSERLILSAHDFEGRGVGVGDVDRRVEAAREGAVVKVAYTARHIVDSFAALDLLRRRGAGAVAIAMGEAGLWTRVLAKKLGGFATYASLEEGRETAHGQLSVAQMTGLFGWDRIDGETKVFGVVGDPVGHSLSPRLFNHWFAQEGVNSVYLPLCVGADDDGLARFLDACHGREWLDVAGLSVTIPHKEAALKWVAEGADSLARSTGSVNTLVLGEGVVGGYNTDCQAAVGSLAHALGGEASEVAGSRIDVLGAGGAARAILYGLREHGCHLTIYGRNLERTRKLADRFSCAAGRWADRVHRTGDVLINTTPVGMWPRVDASPMPAEALVGCGLVFDLIYRPMETRLLKDAAAQGCRTLGGLDMFLRQAAGQFERWTGRSADLEAGRIHLVSFLDAESAA